MADVIQAQAVEQVQEAQPEQTNEINLVKEMETRFKKELAGLNKKNSELERALKDSELAKLTEAERLKAETEMLKAEKTKVEQETKQLTRARVIDKSLFDAGLPQDFAKRISGDNEESIAEDIKAFTDFINAEAEKRAEKIINERLGGKAPIKGAAVSQKSMSRKEFENLNPLEKFKTMKEGFSLYDN
jgi:vacuolar-type H+-ATPase subunit I/STV1